MRASLVLAASAALCLIVRVSAARQTPVVGMVDTPTVTVLRGLTVPEFEAEMQFITSSLGVGCGFCHARGNFASESNPRKAIARRMLEMTRAINQQFFADEKASREPRLGKVTCFTCHQGSERPKTPESGPRWTAENRPFVDTAKPAILEATVETGEFYFVPSSRRKSVCSFVRQLRGPHLSTCA